MFNEPVADSLGGQGNFILIYSGELYANLPCYK